MTAQDTIRQLFETCYSAVPARRAEAVTERKKRLTAFRDWIHRNRNRIHQALHDDFRKPSMETDATEIFHVLNEIKVALASVDRWTAPTRVPTPLYMTGTRGWVQYEPKGVCLVMSPWNYPFSLAAGPLVSALAAGNAVVIKPSEVAPAVSSLIKQMSEDIFDPNVVSVVEGDAEVARTLLELPFDHIFFTGSTAVGKEVMKAAAEHLSSVTLELGGKSPTIVARDARLHDAAERIAVAKFINNGQTCIAPDYVLVDNKVLTKFTAALIGVTTKLYAGSERLEDSPDYARIINEPHFGRIESLIIDAVSRGARIEWDGPRNRATRFMHPVILTDVPADSAIMHEEIFGPVLPLIGYDTLDEALALVRSKPKPLAVYLFSRSRKIKERLSKETSSGAFCVNDCGVQFLHHELPFGGVGNSGMGRAHGYHGFRSFSNEKAVLAQKSGITTARAFYPPFTPRTKRLMDWFLGLLR